MKPLTLCPSRIAVLGVLIFSAATASATTFDLQADWSDSTNPNGTWSYNQGATPLAHVSAWQGLSGDFTSDQPAWARGAVGNTNLPCWFRSLGTVGIAHDWQSGDILTHTTDSFNGVGSGPANVTWTCPENGSITVSGSIWMGRDIGRGNHWTLSTNGTAISSGDIFSGDVYSRTNPFNFSSGSGGAAVLSNISLVAGDIFKLQVDKTSSTGDYAGVNLTIAFIPSFQLRITTTEKFSNNLQLTFTSQAGKSYALQNRTNLASGVWTTLPGSTNFATGNSLQATVTNAFIGSQTFFRAWQLP